MGGARQPPAPSFTSPNVHRAPPSTSKGFFFYIKLWAFLIKVRTPRSPGSRPRRRHRPRLEVSPARFRLEAEDLLELPVGDHASLEEHRQLVHAEREPCVA